jgi:hypothetical protein
MVWHYALNQLLERSYSMENINHTVKSDIWGEPEAECFYCGTPYNPEHSTAPPEYRMTYCSHDCYESDHVRMKNTLENTNATKQSSASDSGSTVQKEAGNFKIRVPRS